MSKSCPPFSSFSLLPFWSSSPFDGAEVKPSGAEEEDDEEEDDGEEEAAEGEEEDLEDLPPLPRDAPFTSEKAVSEERISEEEKEKEATDSTKGYKFTTIALFILALGEPDFAGLIGVTPTEDSTNGCVSDTNKCRPSWHWAVCTHLAASRIALALLPASWASMALRRNSSATFTVDGLVDKENGPYSLHSENSFFLVAGLYNTGPYVCISSFSSLSVSAISSNCNLDGRSFGVKPTSPVVHSLSDRSTTKRAYKIQTADKHGRQNQTRKATVIETLTT